MSVALLSGASSGALHAITGPDHLLSLGPAALRSPGTARRIGLQWGIGHALGTSLLSLPLLFVVQGAHVTALVAALAASSNRLAGLALLATAAWSWRSAKRRFAAAAVETRHPLWVGLVHGVTGAGALLLVLPNLLSGDIVRCLAYLLAFAVGSTLMMMLFTQAIARFGAALAATTVARLQRGLLCGAAALGSAWLLGLAG
jgi:nickel/cobalt transporter (NicO) family protein